AYVLYAAMLLGPIRGDHRSAYEFGMLARRLSERFNDPALTAKVLMNFAWAISIWSRPMEESFPITREASRLGNESGLFVEASYALFNECWFALLAGRDLASFARTCEENVEYVRRIRMHHFAAAPQVILQWG